VSDTLSPAELEAVAEQLAGAGDPVAGPLSADLIAGGRSNLTFRLTDGASRWVLRTPPRAGRTPSAHDVARELRITSALDGTGVPVPRPVLLCEDESLLGGPFAVAAYVDGRVLQARGELDALDDAELDATVTELVRVLAALHGVDHEAAGLGAMARPGDYGARQLKRWSGQWEHVGTGPLEPLGPRVAELASAVADALPPQRVTGVVHGDYRIDNCLLAPDAPRVAAVVDWELATIGDPVADVAMMTAYLDPAFDLVIGEPCAWTSPRLPDADGLAARYEQAGGAALDGWAAHQALACLKVAVIAAGIDHRKRAGAGSGPGFDTAGQAVEPYLDRGLALLT